MTKAIPPHGTDIAAFWSWFSDHSAEIEDLIEKEDAEQLASMMTAPVAKLSDSLGWEFGPGTTTEYQLAFTLMGSLDNLEIAKAVVADAPRLAHWEFCAGRPPKEWNLTFSMMNKRKQVVEIDAKDWQYALVSFNKGSFFDISLFVPNLPAMDKTAKHQAAVIVLQGLLGEVAFLLRIDRIDMLKNATGFEDRLSNITCLPDHLQQLMSNNPHPQ